MGRISFVKFSLNLLFSIFILTGCSQGEEVVPEVAFSISVNVNDPSYNENPFIVRYDNSHRMAGIAGVVVYRLSNDEYYAFDLMCTNEKSINSLVEITDGATCTCPDCGSQFLIVQSISSVLKGPAKWPLKSYSCSISGDYLHIWN